MSLGRFKCNKCEKKLFHITVVQLSIKLFNEPIICKKCHAISIIRGNPDIRKPRLAVSSVLPICMGAIVLSFKINPAPISDPLIIVNFVFSTIFTLIIIFSGQYFLLKKYINIIEVIPTNDAIELLKQKDFKVLFPILKVISLPWIYLQFSIVISILGSIYSIASDEQLEKLIGNPVFLYSIIGGMILGFVYSLLIIKPQHRSIIRSMEKARVKKISMLEDLSERENYCL